MSYTLTCSETVVPKIDKELIETTPYQRADKNRRPPMGLILSWPLNKNMF